MVNSKSTENINFPKVDCLILQENLNKFSDIIANNPDLLSKASQSWSIGIQTRIKEEYSLKLSNLDLYSNLASQYQRKFSFSEDEIIIVISALERLAISYLGLSQFKTTRLAIKNLHEKYTSLVRHITETSEEIEENLDAIETQLKIFSSDLKKPSEYMQAFNSLIAASHKLGSLPHFISESPFAKTAEFNKSARATDLALHTWVKSLYAFWSSALGRTIHNSNDGINGRKYLLEFLSDAMAPLHEAIEFETLNNMLRKVQKEVKRDGGLSPLNFNLGSSSPI